MRSRLPFTAQTSFAARLAAALLAATSIFVASTAAADASLPFVVVAADASTQRAAHDGVVEALRQTVVAAQIAGAITSIDVRAGDRVQAGQVLARIDARSAEQNSAAADAQVAAARAALEVASKEVERQRALFQKRYISEAALDRAEAQFKSTEAQVRAQVAQAGSARTQTSFFVVRAPYAGVVSEVPIAMGDMAMPGRALVTLYDPAAMRVSAPLPQSALPRAPVPADVRIDIPGAADGRAPLVPTRVTVLPAADAGAHTVTVRFDLPNATPGLAPGMFARVSLPAAALAGGSARITVPQSAIVRRGDVIAVYVLDAQGKPRLRQVRLGRASGDSIEVLAGLSQGERVALTPQAAARLALARE